MIEFNILIIVTITLWGMTVSAWIFDMEYELLYTILRILTTATLLMSLISLYPIVALLTVILCFFLDVKMWLIVIGGIGVIVITFLKVLQ